MSSIPPTMSLIQVARAQSRCSLLWLM
uniref:Uncharacterized protein n=1 Tax=Arundo donax TaxID=35708 RepID=A0A0A9AWF8_ARUDO